MRYCETLKKIQRNPGISSPFLVRTKILVQENEELLPPHTIVHETECGFATQFPADWNTLPIRLSAIRNEGYANFLKRIRNLKTRGYEVKAGVESTGNTRYFKTQVEKAGAEVTVINNQ